MIKQRQKQYSSSNEKGEIVQPLSIHDHRSARQKLKGELLTPRQKKRE